MFQHCDDIVEKQRLFVVKIKYRFLGYSWEQEKESVPKWFMLVTVLLFALGAAVFIGAVILVVVNIVDIGTAGVNFGNVLRTLLGCILILFIITRK